MNFAEMTDKDLKVTIAANLATSDQWLLRGLVAVYEHQTHSEQVQHQTTDKNGVGFSGRDAYFLSSLAQQYQERGYLSPRQIECLRKSMKKYAGQLVKIVKGKI